MNDATKNYSIAQRFRGFLPVVVDVETGGFDNKTDALLEIAATLINLQPDGMLQLGDTFHFHLEPFEGANLDPKALAFTGIDPYHPFREAVPETQGLRGLFQPIRQAVKAANCNRAILVGHNAFFDLGFINAAVARTGIKRNPFHPFSTLDTVSLAALAYGQTVLAKAAIAAGMPWDGEKAHSAVYDTEQTARLFCNIVNQWQQAYPQQAWSSAK